ncbi:MAG: recombinase family protein [Firmicutes bacterium]|uniref:Recombinase family protein n=1 Tax=Candidatus Onthovivens merdipullorum TaxID=2840889 RepID=A0A9D9GVX5_9BACL|nr:recombinase family protein [Candidatus Onthovivens merdipullorum]
MKENKEYYYLSYSGEYGLIYNLIKITYITRDDGFKYILKPSKSVISLLPKEIKEYLIDRISINKEYKELPYLDNIIPNFLKDFIKDDLDSLNNKDLLKSLDLKKVKTINNLFINSFTKKVNIDLTNIFTKENITGVIKKILNELALGNNVTINETKINNKKRKAVFNTLMFIYNKSIEANKLKQKEGIDKAKIRGKYKGRIPSPIDLDKFKNEYQKVLNKEITAQKVIKNLNISKDKYYRTIKLLNKNLDNIKEK